MTHFIGLHPDFRYRVDYVGHERAPVLVIDNFLNQAEILIDVAESHCTFGSADGFYPGIRAKAPDLYMDVMSHFLGDIITSTFCSNDERIVSSKTSFSMVVTPPGQLSPAQCFPHIDSLRRTDLASVHYLCAGDKGGTSLYRHRATGFESINPERDQVFFSTVKAEMASLEDTRQYMNGSNAFFEQIASYDALFNRMLIYRGTSLHSGNIAPDFTFDPHPRTGRLTLNTFLYCSE